MGETQADQPTPENTSGGSGGGDADEPIPFMQQVLDNPFLLLFLGITVPTVFYVIWGVMEVVAIPVAS